MIYICIYIYREREHIIKSIFKVDKILYFPFKPLRLMLLSADSMMLWKEKYQFNRKLNILCDLQICNPQHEMIYSFTNNCYTCYSQVLLDALLLEVAKSSEMLLDYNFQESGMWQSKQNKWNTRQQLNSWVIYLYQKYKIKHRQRSTMNSI